MIRSPQLIFTVVLLSRNALTFTRSSVASTQMSDAAVRSGIEVSSPAGVRSAHLAGTHYQ